MHVVKDDGRPSDPCFTSTAYSWDAIWVDSFQRTFCLWKKAYYCGVRPASWPSVDEVATKTNAAQCWSAMTNRCLKLLSGQSWTSSLARCTLCGWHADFCIIARLVCIGTRWRMPSANPSNYSRWPTGFTITTCGFVISSYIILHNFNHHVWNQHAGSVMKFELKFILYIYST